MNQHQDHRAEQTHQDQLLVHAGSEQYAPADKSLCDQRVFEAMPLSLAGLPARLGFLAVGLIALLIQDDLVYSN